MMAHADKQSMNVQRPILAQKDKSDVKMVLVLKNVVNALLLTVVH
jgi:hypothetical protein